MNASPAPIARAVLAPRRRCRPSKPRSVTRAVLRSSDDFLAASGWRVRDAPISRAPEPVQLGGDGGAQRPPRPARGRRRGRSRGSAQGPSGAPAAPGRRAHGRDEVPRPARTSRGLVGRDAAETPSHQGVRRGEHARRVRLGVPRAAGSRRGRHGGVDVRREHDRGDAPVGHHHAVFLDLADGVYGERVKNDHVLVVVNAFWSGNGEKVGQPWELGLKKRAAAALAPTTGDWEKVYVARRVRSAAGGGRDAATSVAGAVAAVRRRGSR